MTLLSLTLNYTVQLIEAEFHKHTYCMGREGGCCSASGYPNNEKTTDASLFIPIVLCEFGTTTYKVAFIHLSNVIFDKQDL